MIVGMVGIGAMGRPMAENLLKGGFAVTAYDMNPAAAEPLRRRGADIADSLVDLAGRVEVAILMLPGPDDVLAVGTELLQLDGSLELLIDMSTSDPAVDEQLAQIAAKAGKRYVDAPVSRAVQAAWDADLLVMAGGEREDVERATPIFEAFASAIHYCGPVGSGHKMKLLNNLKIMSEVALIAEVFRLARRAGLNLTVVEATLSQSSARSFMWDYQASRMVTGDYDPGFTVSLGLKDLGLVHAWAEESSVTLPLAEAAIRIFRRGVERGFGALDTASLVSPEMDEVDHEP